MSNIASAVTSPEMGQVVFSLGNIIWAVFGGLLIIIGFFLVRLINTTDDKDKELSDKIDQVSQDCNYIKEEVAELELRLNGKISDLNLKIQKICVEHDVYKEIHKERRSEPR